MIEVIVRVVSAGVMAYPDFSVDVRRIGMSLVIAEVVLRFVGMRRAMERAGAVSGWVGRAVRCLVLSECRYGENEQACKNKLNFFHRYLQIPCREGEG
jgi:hypothetical protein